MEMAEIHLHQTKTAAAKEEQEALEEDRQKRKLF